MRWIIVGLLFSIVTVAMATETSMGLKYDIDTKKSQQTGTEKPDNTKDVGTASSIEI